MQAQKQSARPVGRSCHATRRPIRPFPLPPFVSPPSGPEAKRERCPPTSHPSSHPALSSAAPCSPIPGPEAKREACEALLSRCTALLSQSGDARRAALAALVQFSDSLPMGGESGGDLLVGAEGDKGNAGGEQGTQQGFAQLLRSCLVGVGRLLVGVRSTRGQRAALVAREGCSKALRSFCATAW